MSDDIADVVLEGIGHGEERSPSSLTTAMTGGCSSSWDLEMSR